MALNRDNSGWQHKSTAMPSVHRLWNFRLLFSTVLQTDARVSKVLLKTWKRRFHCSFVPGSFVENHGKFSILMCLDAALYVLKEHLRTPVKMKMSFPMVLSISGCCWHSSSSTQVWSALCYPLLTGRSLKKKKSIKIFGIGTMMPDFSPALSYSQLMILALSHLDIY